MTNKTKLLSIVRFTFFLGAFTALSTFATSCYEGDGELVEPIRTDYIETNTDQLTQSKDCVDIDGRNYACF